MAPARASARASAAPVAPNVRPTGHDAYRDPGGRVIPGPVHVVRARDVVGDSTVSADAVVIGSGAGGAVVAKELAEGGMKVVVVEEGELRRTDERWARPRDAFVNDYRAAAQFSTLGSPPLVTPAGRLVGGTSAINSGTCFRTPAVVLERWRDRLGLEELTEEELDPYFRRVEREINVCQVPPDVAGRNAAVVKRGADRLGYSGDFLYRNVRGCIGSGVCCFGCPAGAKQHVGVTYMPKAWKAGAVTYTSARAERIRVEHGAVVGIEAELRVSGKRPRLTVDAPIVIVACGTILSPVLLMRNRLGGGLAELGRNLSVHPATGARALFDEEIDMAQGVPQSYYIDEFGDEGIMLEGAAGPPDYMSATIAFLGRNHSRTMEGFRRLSQFGLMVSDTSRGSVRSVRGQPLARYDLNSFDMSRVKKGLVELAKIYWAAGATEVFLPLDRLPVLRDGDVSALERLDLRPSELEVMAFHPLGTCRMGGDPRRSVVDHGLRFRGVGGLYVADGSVIPTPLGVNPQVTIMTLATRLAYSLLGKAPPRDEPEPERLPNPRVGLGYLRDPVAA